MTRPAKPLPIPELPNLPLALCADDKHDPEMWHPRTGGGSAVDAKAICRGTETTAPCPELDACLAYALGNDVTGVWAGTTVNDRRDWRRRNGIRPSSLSTMSVVEARQAVDTPPVRARVTPETIAHGTMRGANQHHKLKVPPCDACRAAELAYRADLREKRRQREAA